MNGPVASDRRARLAVVGLGRMGGLHAANLAGRVPSARLVAAVDAVEAPARDLGEALGVPWSTSLESVFSDVAVDGIVIAAPTGLHARLVEIAAAAGKHIFCEKPLGFDPEECRRAIEAAGTAGVALQVGFQRRFDPGWCALAEALEGGRLGDLAMFRASHRNPAVPLQSRQLGDLFLDVAIHDLDAARWLGGEAIEVFAWRAAPPHCAVGISLRFASGALGLIDVNRSVGYGFECTAELIGSRATARLGDGRAAVDVLSEGRASAPLAVDHADRHAEAYVSELEHFGELVLGRRTSKATGGDAFAATELARAAARSADEGAPVTLADRLAVGGEP